MSDKVLASTDIFYGYFNNSVPCKLSLYEDRFELVGETTFQIHL
jgi:hypothetical protein